MNKAVVAGLVSLAVHGCNENEYLGRGYIFDEYSGYISNGKVSVNPYVRRFERVGRYPFFAPYVVGERQEAAPPYNLPDYSQHFGFFILDTRDGTLIEGLDQAGFATALSERGLKNPF